MEIEIDCTHTREITCPYCGAEFSDSWEVGMGVNDGELGELECGSCEKTFIANRNCSITYNSYTTPCLNGEVEHNWQPVVGIPKEYFKDKYRCKICYREEKHD